MSDSKLDEAARAGWLYYVAGNTQDEIARKLGVSRQSAQRLVAMAVSERLVKVRLDHPIARCMELAHRVREQFGLTNCEVVPSDADAPGLLTGVAIAGAAEMERHLRSKEPRIIGLGTGRALRACTEQLPKMDCPQHRIVSRLGNMMQDGSASPYNAAVRLAERVGARQYPMALPVLARSKEELGLLQDLPPVQNTMDLCARADVSFVGIGQLDENAPMMIDGFITRGEMRSLIGQGAVGEITSWVYNAEGRILPTGPNERVLSAALGTTGEAPIIGVAVGASKTPAIRAAMIGGLVNCLITDEATAELVLKT